MTFLIFQGNKPIQQISPLDRGLAYGDGLFETILVVHGELIWWATHWQRLTMSAERLGIALPDEELIQNAALQLSGLSRCVIKIILTRGVGGRGYAATSGPSTVIVSVHPAPAVIQKPITIGWCQTMASQQPALAGMKHLNRLENVLARSELQADTYFDGLMCDVSGAVICSSSANVFVYFNQRWRTPDLSQCGIHGIARQWFIDNCPGVVIEQLTRFEVENAQAIFLCNSVRGMMEVNRVSDIEIQSNDVCVDLKKQFLNSNPAFSIE
jgi:4-amino-4-deoxychorismate lyase